MSTIRVDSHQDLYSALTGAPHYRNQTNLDDIARFLNIVHVSIFIEPDQYSKSRQVLKKETEKQLKFYQNLVESDNRFMIIRDFEDVERALSYGKTGLLIHFEGAESVDSLEYLEWLYSEGVRSVGLVWNRQNLIAEPSTGDQAVGLSEFGKNLVERMIEKRMIVDLAHSSRQSISDILELCSDQRYPCINSHTAAEVLCANPRNCTDDELKSVASLGGVSGVFAAPRFLCDGPSCRDDYMRHLAHFLKVAGDEAVGIGSDFGGVGSAFGCTKDFSSTSCFEGIEEAMGDAGIRQDAIKKVLGENYLRFYKKIWG